MYLDSAILVKLVVREPDSGFYADLVNGQPSAHSSELAAAECRSALLRKRKQGSIDARTCRQAWERLQALWSDGGGLCLQPVTWSVLEEAGDIMERCIAHVPLRTLDAVHLASCRLARAYPLVTNDRIMRAAAARLAMPLNALPA